MSGEGPAHDRLADTVRALINEMLETYTRDEAAEAATADVLAALEKLRAAGTGPREPHTDPARGDYTFFFRFSPVSGTSNPIAPPLRLEFGADNEVRAKGSLGRAYEGPPGYVHGAFVAAMFDEILGVANAAGGSPAMTGLLEVRYLRPTPLNTELRIVARHTGSSGRKSFATAEIMAGDEITAEGKGTFIAVTMERAQEIFGKHLELLADKEIPA
jgi:acyl-coenzyme A thioesterase PaaI-like protein